MARRHEGLIPVAREHHDGLILAVRLQQGENALPRLWQTDCAYQAEYVQTFLADNLENHFRAEETVIFPLASEHVPDARPTVTLLREQHQEIQKRIKAMKGRENDVTREDLVSLGVLIEQHIRLEDRHLFPLIEDRLADAILSQLTTDIAGFYPGERKS